MELTGKALIITREIVMTGGEYLEEDPAYERLLARRRQSAESPRMGNSGLESFMNRRCELILDAMRTNWLTIASVQDRVQFVNGYPQQSESPVQQARSQNTPLKSTKEVSSIDEKQFSEIQILTDTENESLHPDEQTSTQSISPQYLHNSTLFEDMMSNQNWMGSNNEPMVYLDQQDLDGLLASQDGAYAGFQVGHRDVSLWDNDDDAFNQGNEHVAF
jgi:hypothetical protein